MGGKRRSGGVGGFPCPPELIQRLDRLEERLKGMEENARRAQVTRERLALALELLVAGYGKVHGMEPPTRGEGAREGDEHEAGPSVIGPRKRAGEARPVPRPAKKRRSKFVDLADIERGMERGERGESEEGKGKGKEKEVVVEVEGSDEENEGKKENDEEETEEEGKVKEDEEQEGAVSDSAAAS